MSRNPVLDAFSSIVALLTLPAALRHPAPGTFRLIGVFDRLFRGSVVILIAGLLLKLQNWLEGSSGSYGVTVAIFLVGTAIGGVMAVAGSTGLARERVFQGVVSGYRLPLDGECKDLKKRSQERIAGDDRKWELSLIDLQKCLRARGYRGAQAADLLLAAVIMSGLFFLLMLLFLGAAVSILLPALWSATGTGFVATGALVLVLWAAAYLTGWLKFAPPIWDKK